MELELARLNSVLSLFANLSEKIYIVSLSFSFFVENKRRREKNGRKEMLIWWFMGFQLEFERIILVKLRGEIYQNILELWHHERYVRMFQCDQSMFPLLYLLKTSNF